MGDGLYEPHHIDLRLTSKVANNIKKNVIIVVVTTMWESVIAPLYYPGPWGRACRLYWDRKN